MRLAAVIFLIGLTACSLVRPDSSDPPAGWYEIPLNGMKHYELKGLHFINTEVGWVVGRRTAEVGHQSLLGITSDGGKSWHYRFFDSITLRDVYSFNTARGVAANINIRYTEDGGESWKIRRRFADEHNGGVFSLDFGSSVTGWGAGPRGAVAKSENGGENWDYLDLGYDDTFFNDIAAYGDNKAWVLSYDSLIQTEDGGETWKETDLAEAVSAPPVRYYAVDFADENHGWIAGSFRRILHTRDGGHNWILQHPLNESQSNFDGFMDVSASDSLNALAVTGHGGVMRTRDGGNTWYEQLPAKDEGGSFRLIQLLDAEVAYAITGAGRLMKTVTGGDVTGDHSFAGE